MDTQTLSTWEDFKAAVSKLRADCQQRQEANPEMRLSMPSFRGHASKDWKLETTLERAGHLDMPLRRYGHLMARTAPEINTLANRNFKVPNVAEFDAWLGEVERTSYFPPGAPPGYDFMVYLRYHGFPSPLLDWTDSEFVAAYFAFIDASERTDEHVAIFAYMEYATGSKISSALAPSIVGTGPYVMTHPRHFTQQARYTYCRRYDQQWSYASHELAFGGDVLSIHGHQDALIKYVLPVSERKAVLDELRRYNLTPYSLFQTEESLMKTMALKVL